MSVLRSHYIFSHPLHFAASGMWSLLQVATMDSWSSDIARSLYVLVLSCITLLPLFAYHTSPSFPPLYSMTQRGAWTFWYFLSYILAFGL